MIEIVFTPDEREIVINEARRRQEYNENKNIRGRNGGAERGDRAFLAHLLGAAGEMAVASYLGLKEHVFLELTPVKGSCDLPGNIDVKTRNNHNRDLIVQFDDVTYKNYWLVTIQNKVIRIHGWLPHSKCALNEYKSDPAGGRPAYFIPQDKLYLPESWSRTANKEN